MWEKIKAWFKSTWEKIIVWVKKNWFMILNYLIIFITFGVFFGREDVFFAELFLGGWIVFSVIYAIYKKVSKKQ